jgi:pimeloyl-ACP methyl ester carboxylesterase
MTPFTIAIADADVAELKSRLQHARFPDEVEDAGWEYGTSLAFLRRFVAYWGNQFDWRAAEARLNRTPQFTTEIDGETVHFVHARGKGSNPVPLLLANGWPSNFVELLPLVDRLTNEVDGISFDVIIPSLPGYGFSGRPKHKGMNLTRTAQLWAKLMDQLGYPRFLASGSDLGGGAVLSFVRHIPQRLLGAHYCNVYSQYPRPEQPTEEEVEYFKKVDYAGFAEAAYAMVQGTKPTTLAVGLNDSPAGLASWILEKFHSWGDTGGEVESVFPFETLATLLSVYWFSETIGSSVRMYKEAFADHEITAPMETHGVPQGVLVPADSDLPAPRAWGERNLQNLIHWNEAGQGGHFPALEVPDVLAADIRAFHREIARRG